MNKSLAYSLYPEQMQLLGEQRSADDVQSIRLRGCRGIDARHEPAKYLVCGLLKCPHPRLTRYGLSRIGGSPPNFGGDGRHIGRYKGGGPKVTSPFADDAPGCITLAPVDYANDRSKIGLVMLAPQLHGA
jgi:hypothetical protein